MKPFVKLCFALIIFCFSCNNNETDQVLSNAPFDDLTDSIARSPKSAALYYRRGTLLFANGRLYYAEKDLRKAWTLAPKETYALSLVTILKQISGDSALLFLQQATRQAPASVALSVELAKLYRARAEVDKALQICDSIINRYPGQLDALVLKADLLYDENRLPEAIAVLEKAYSYAPNDAGLVHKLAFQYAEAKNPKVLVLADTLIRADAKNGRADPYYFKGLYFENTGNIKEALRYFDEAIQHDYNFLDAYMDKGQVLYHNKAYKEAAQTFSLALRVDPLLAEAYYWLGKTGEALGAKEEACLNYERAYALDTSIKEAAEGAQRLK